MKPLFICLIAALPLIAAAQTTYRWVDQDGKVHYSDQPPPKEIKKVEQRRLGANSIDISGLPYETRLAAENYPVTFYSAPDCKAECQVAREFLTRRGVPFNETSVSTPEQAAAYRKSFATDKLSFPSLVVGSQKQQGFEEGLWGGLLDSAGYPHGKGAGSAAK